MSVRCGDAKKLVPVERQAWRVREYCEAYRISSSTFWKYVALGKIRVVRVGGRVLVPIAEADRIAREGL